jgi:hypothetical protein
MARLVDPEILRKFRHALSHGRFNGYVTWKPRVRQWIEQNMEGWTTRAIAEELFCFFESGGEIDQIRETRPEWSEHRYHYDLRIGIEGRLLYVETILMESDPRDPTIHVVSIHDA